jgi:hypothetical protein
MNIFVLDENPEVAAVYHGDKHVVKMIVETAQLLSTAHHYYNSPIAPLVYKKTHVNHPSTIWVRTNSTNYTWAFALLKFLLKEYTHRYGKIHSTSSLVDNLSHIPQGMPITTNITPFALAMPDQYKIKGNAVESYRQYYLHEKQSVWSWKKREIPFWMSNLYKTTKKVV